MKLRIHRNSIRFRVTQSEVARLSSGAKLECGLQFVTPDSVTLGYAIEVSPLCDEVCASFSGNGIVLTIPENVASTWASTNQIGIEHTQRGADGSALHIVIEKDFRCLRPRPAENEFDSYPNPTGAIESE